MELHDYIRILRKGWLFIVVAVLVGTGVGAGYSLIQTPSYQSTAKVFVSTQSSGSSQDLVQGNLFTVQRVKTYSDLIATPLVLSPVVSKLSLGVSAEKLSDQVSATSAVDTSIITIVVTDRNAGRAAAIANAASDSLSVVVQAIETSNEVGALSPVKLTRAQDATVALRPLTPNVLINVILGFLIGLTLGVVGSVLRETLDTRIRGERDVRQLTGAPILGGIIFDAKASVRPLIVHVDPTNPRAESFRALRTNLQFLDVGRTERSFVVTSSIQTEGKSTTTANLAIALADAGARVLLVDADLRRPKIAEYMDLEGAVGLTDVLIGRADLREAVQPWGLKELYVLPAGHIPPNPSELLGSTAMSTLIDEMNRQFDVVLFDAPPLLPVTDAAILAKIVSSAILVVAIGAVHKNHLRSAIGVLENVGVHAAGIILTMVPTKGPDAYGYGRYGYGYGYGYSYQTELKIKI